MSRPTRTQLVVWRSFLEGAYALIDILDTEMQTECDLSLRWYDVLLHLEEADGLPMNDLAERILFSKSGLTRVIDRMEAEGLVRRERPPGDRRVIQVYLTPGGIDVLARARQVHHRGLEMHFVRHLDGPDFAAMSTALSKLSEHLRALRPGRLAA